MKGSGSGVFELLNNAQFVQWINNPSEELSHFWTNWINHHPEKRKDVEIARKIIQSARVTIDEPLSNEAYVKILENVVSYSARSRHINSFNKARTWKLIGIAASILIFLAWGIYNYLPDPETEQYKFTTTIYKQAPLGSRITTQLPDGSIVTLNSGSQIIFPSNFDGEIREVSLDGEAFFEVHRDSDKPFLVRTNENLVRVLGTSFNVRSYLQEEEMRVSVSSGLVSYTASTGDEILLKKDEEAIYSSKVKKIEKGSVNRKRAFGWKDKILYFDSKSLSEIVIELERWYGIEIQVDENIERRGTYSGEFYNPSLKEVLKGLSFVYRFDFSIQDGLVEIKFIDQTN